ncbi:MAG: putative toxin-antitoxin system toxin component, PIN family [Candidatus Altiarchaeota archaeon]
MRSTVRNSRQHKVFIDANTLLSGLFFEGPESTLLKIGILGQIRLVTCDFVVKEVRTIIRRKFSGAENHFDDIISIMTVLPTEKDELRRGLIRDRKDAPILATALKYKPDYFVTGDKEFHTPEIKKLLNVVKTRNLLDRIL